MSWKPRRTKSLEEILSLTQVKLLEFKGAQVHYIGKTVRVAGSEIDFEFKRGGCFKFKKVLDRKINHQGPHENRN